MGDHVVKQEVKKEAQSIFVGHLLDDVQALETMLEKQLIEDGITRIGAEQEFCLVNENWRPANNAEEILAEVNDHHFTTELARYNLEINLDPLELKADCFRQVEKQVIKYLLNALEIANKHKTKIVLTGILPTISKTELELDFMTPNPRYYALNNMFRELKGGDFELSLRGVDELSVKHDSVLFEACNTSFQVHLQISPTDFVSSYNWAQAISGPVLGISTNSPLLLGRELWSETRIGLFQQSIDTRSSSYALKQQQPRVAFGNHWAQGTIADIFKEQIARHKVILVKDIERNSVDLLNKGVIPNLQALNLHNSSVYSWNRPCYGEHNGVAHVRIENRYLPSGPSVVDEMANFAFWVGLMKGRPKKFNDMTNAMDFRDAKLNFTKAAHNGKESVFCWMGEKISARDLAIKELLPIAYSGLERSGVDKQDIERYLSTIEKRAVGFTGSQWMIRNYRNLRKQLKQDEALLALTKAIHENQVENRAVNNWEDVAEIPDAHEAAHTLGHIMSTQLFTVSENDLAELATTVMKWQRIAHIPVEDNQGRLCGLLTRTHMRKYAENKQQVRNRSVAEIMVKELHSGYPDMEIEDAIKLMKKHEIGCLPIVQNDVLVGIVTIRDIIEFDNG